MWTEGDILGISLTVNDRTEPYPDVVHRCLTNKLRNARALKKELFESIGEQRRLLIDRHRSCYEQAKRDLNVLFEVTRAQCKNKGNEGEDEINNEISGLIGNSTWQKLVNVSRVRNLTTNEVNTQELELLSLGIDFRLQGAKKSIMDTAVAFHKYESFFLK